jgi:hypothetical protein
MTENINYKGKKYPVSVGYYALKHASREVTKEGGTDLSMDAIMSGNLENYEPLLYYSLVMGARLENQVLDLEREEMEFMLNECLWEFLEVLPKFFPKLGNLQQGTVKSPKKK